MIGNNTIVFDVNKDFFDIPEVFASGHASEAGPQGPEVPGPAPYTSLFTCTDKEQLKQNVPQSGKLICPNPVGFYVDENNGRHLAPCRSWDCPVCGHRKKIALMNRVGEGTRQGIEKGGYRWRMVTLTQQSDDPTNIMHAWNRVRAALRRSGFKRLDFVLAKEFTVKGKRHLHIAINAYIPQKTLSKIWKRATSGHSYVTWITGRNIKSASGYLFKYITKGVQYGHQFRKGEHRYSFSRRIGGLNFRAPRFTPPIQYIFYPYLKFGFCQEQLDVLPLGPDYTNVFRVGEPPPSSVTRQISTRKVQQGELRSVTPYNQLKYYCK